MARYNIIGTSAGTINGYNWGKLHYLEPAKEGCVGNVPVSLKTSYEVASTIRHVGQYDLEFDRYGRVVHAEEVKGNEKG